ncbi:hypothetical protein AVEN_93453-1 [Araneus ventricosus]|uniref:Uncharacterized protein n=1 Tax=Araneus ventricosus TaxID=182803 RepID=A0A4Y2APH6_ARAVE|nr:hypothetical protein AVEN_93453-1 [Araneus ventricosus]
MISLGYIKGRGGLVVRPRRRDRRVAGPKPDSTEEDPPCMGPAERQIIRSSHKPPRRRGAAASRGGASLGAAPSPDRCSKLRGPSLNSSRFVSKRNVNLT